MKKFIVALAAVLIVGACAFFFLKDKVQISWNTSGKSESVSGVQSTESPEQGLGGQQSTGGKLLTVDDATKILAATVQVNNAVWKYFDTMEIEGESYIAFAGYDEGGAIGDTLIVVNEKNGELYCYDTTGELFDYSEYQEAVMGSLAENEIINGGGLHTITEDIRMVNGDLVLSGLYTTMGPGESAMQILRNNGIVTDKTEDELAKELPTQQSHDGGREGEDMVSLGNQKMFGMPCDIRLNFSSGQSEDGTWGGLPYLEEISVRFNGYIKNMNNLQNLDLDERVKSKFISFMGEPTKTITSHNLPEDYLESYSEDELKLIMSDTSVIYQWELKNDIVYLQYSQWEDRDDEIVGFEKGNILSFITVRSKVYIEERQAIAKENAE